MELKSRVIKGPQPGPRLLITAGVHGDEYEPMAAVRALLRQLQSRDLCGSVTLAPVVNEPAFARAARAADDELDLARTCPGRVDGSITEQIADALSRLILQSTHYIDLHTGGAALKIVPLAGYMLHADAAVLTVQRRMARAFNQPLVWGTSANLDGRSLSVARDANIPAIYVEYGGGGGCDQEIVDSYVAGCLNIMRELGVIDIPTPNSNVREVVEDPRDSAGVLQVHHPAPADGFFAPLVSLGQQVRRGDSIGTVFDALGEETYTVTAEQTGGILMLRAIPRVKAGDALAAILPADAPRVEVMP